MNSERSVSPEHCYLIVCVYIKYDKFCINFKERGPKIESEYDQEIRKSQTTDKPMASRE